MPTLVWQVPLMYNESYYGLQYCHSRWAFGIPFYKWGPGLRERRSFVRVPHAEAVELLIHTTNNPGLIWTWINMIMLPSSQKATQVIFLIFDYGYGSSGYIRDAVWSGLCIEAKPSPNDIGPCPFDGGSTFCSATAVPDDDDRSATQTSSPRF